MVNLVYINGDGHKEARPVLNREEYIALRNGGEQKAIVAAVRSGNEQQKSRLVQMNYSCLPNDDGTLKGTKRIGNTVGMDIDHVKPTDMLPLRERILAKKDELGLRMLELSARAAGYHLVFQRRPELSQEENLKWASQLLGVEFDKAAKDITRVFYTTTGSAGDLIYLDDEIFEIAECAQEKAQGDTQGTDPQCSASSTQLGQFSPGECGVAIPCVTTHLDYDGIPYKDIIRKWWEMYNEGKEPKKNNRDVLTFELAVNLRHICGFDRELMDKVIPCYDHFPEVQKMKCIDSALAAQRTQMPKRLKDVLMALRRDEKYTEGSGPLCALDDMIQEDERFYYSRLPKMPQGLKDSIDSVGPQLAMPALVAVTPIIGMLATGVRLDVHGRKNALNLIAYVAGDFASGKGSIDPLVDAWTGELKAVEKMYQQQEDEWRAKKRAAKNKKEQPEEPKLPVRLLTLNNTVANLAERLANTDGKHAFSFTPEADTVAQKWKSSINDFSVMLRQSYDGSPYDREARSAEAVNVHIDHLLWNVLMCGTPDALYRVVQNYTDGFQSRIAVARTPDNTYAKLEDKPYVLTDRQQERIRQVAHLLPLMQGDVVLPKLEQKGREWVEQVRLEAMKSDDKVRARQRFRICVTAQRITCCIMLCKVADQLIAKYGCSGAEKQLKGHPDTWKTMLLKQQTPQLLDVYDVVADYLMDCALYFFRERIEAAFASRDYVGLPERRQRPGGNDSIYERLDTDFGFEGALQHTIGVKGNGVTRNQVRQMLKNWKIQGLIVQTERGRYRKVQPNVS